MDDIKKLIEDTLGYKINNYKIVPKYYNGSICGFDINIEPVRTTEYITVDLKILPTSNINDDMCICETTCLGAYHKDRKCKKLPEK